MLSYLFSKTKKANTARCDSSSDSSSVQTLPPCAVNKPVKVDKHVKVEKPTKKVGTKNTKPPTVTPSLSLCTPAILSIWQKRISVGTAVFVQFAGITAHEGVIVQLNFQKGYAVLKNVAGLTYIPLTDAIYVEVLCACSEKSKKKKDNKRTKCCTVDSNIWANVHVGNAVFADVADSPFVATVEEVNLKHNFAGLRTVSGVTYIPFENVNLVRVQKTA